MKTIIVILLILLAVAVFVLAEPWGTFNIFEGKNPTVDPIFGIVHGLDFTVAGEVALPVCNDAPELYFVAGRQDVEPIIVYVTHETGDVVVHWDPNPVHWSSP